MIVNDRDSLSIWVKCIQGAIFEGGNIYKSCITMKKFTIDFDERIKDQEAKLITISQDFDPKTSSIVDHEGQIISLHDKIIGIVHEKNRVVERVCELRGLIGPKIEKMFSALKEAKFSIVVSD
jgi:hypothetical protein